MRVVCAAFLVAGCSLPHGKEAVRTDAPASATGDAAHVIDGAVDALVDSSGWQVAETITVPGSGQARTSMMFLYSGVTYRLRATGTFLTNDQSGMLADAEYWGFESGSPQDTMGNVDVGLAVDDTIVDIMRTPKWGPYTSSHVYEVDFPGQGAPIVAMFHDGNYVNNSGTLTLQILTKD